MVGKDKEVKTGTDATISCVISGITQAVQSVVWKTSSSTNVVTDDSTNYVQNDGSYQSASNSQTTELTVKAAKTDQDVSYTCVITANEWGGASPKPTIVNLNVFGKFTFT